MLLLPISTSSSKCIAELLCCIIVHESESQLFSIFPSPTSGASVQPLCTLFRHSSCWLLFPATWTTTWSASQQQSGEPADALPIISWSEFQRRVTQEGELLILVAGSIIDVAELQEGEHKGGAVYNPGADMTNMFGGAHAHPPDRDSLHMLGMRVVENIQKKVKTYTVALLDEATRPTDPDKIRIDLDVSPSPPMDLSHAGHRDCESLWDHASLR